MECMMCEAISGESSYEEFCDDLGYEPGSEARKIWKKCKKVRYRMQKLLGDKFDTLHFP